MLAVLPLQVETGSWGTVQDGCQSDLWGGKQQTCIGHGCLCQKVIGALPQWFWILQWGVSCLRDDDREKVKIQWDIWIWSQNLTFRSRHRHHHHPLPHTHTPSGQWVAPPLVCRGCGPPGENWVAGWAVAHTLGSAPEPFPALLGSPAQGSPQTGCWTRWTHPLYRTGMHMSALHRKMRLKEGFKCCIKLEWKGIKANFNPSQTIS